MIVVALDTTTPRGSVALWRDGGVVALEPTDLARPFSDQLPGAIQDLLAREGLSVADVDVFAVATGPGSLTGLRVGIATVQGLAFARGRPVVGVSLLEALASEAALAAPSLAAGDWAGAMTDARRGEVFGALYRVGPDRQVPPICLVEGPAVGAAVGILEAWARHVRDGRLRVAGDGAEANVALLAARLGPTTSVATGGLVAGRVAGLAALRVGRGEVIAPHALQPLYVRRPDAEAARDKRRTGGAGGEPDA